MIQCQTESNRFSSAERTWITLVEAARQNDIKTFVSGIDLVPTFQAMGYSEKDIDILVKTIRDRIEDSKFDELKTNMAGFMKIFTKANFVILGEEQAGVNMRLLLVKSIPKAGSNLRESMDKWYFTKRDNKWLLSPDLTAAKTGYY